MFHGTIESVALISAIENEICLPFLSLCFKAIFCTLFHKGYPYAKESKYQGASLPKKIGLTRKHLCFEYTHSNKESFRGLDKHSHSSFYSDLTNFGLTRDH